MTGRDGFLVLLWPLAVREACERCLREELRHDLRVWAHRFSRHREGERRESVKPFGGNHGFRWMAHVFLVSINGESPKMDGLEWKIPLHWIIWGYPYFRKPPYVFFGFG